MTLLVITFCCLTVYGISLFEANLDSSLFESFNKFMIFVFRFFMILTDFCENSEVVYSDFSMIKKNFALSSLSFQIKLNCCFKLGLRQIRFVCLNLLQFVYNALKNTHSPINYQSCNRYFF